MKSKDNKKEEYLLNLIDYLKLQNQALQYECNFWVKKYQQEASKKKNCTNKEDKLQKTNEIKIISNNSEWIFSSLDDYS
ncbi:hypothetical protein [Mycoplasmopsis sturni]|uniref:hypothetical protein n=1 Tax=Mycoplasmopsis sturni TaxID=39047 RepID=UPI000562CD5B|nr:hypothetical protein [Mycoplasmopsis sturni]